MRRTGLRWARCGRLAKVDGVFSPAADERGGPSLAAGWVLMVLTVRFSLLFLHDEYPVAFMDCLRLDPLTPDPVFLHIGFVGSVHLR
ncbi:hypothetical protein NDU88_005217 [Pleurodeles waltl]|uniref:Uncharacterized protein n=1 Tax=Pleurodeles waltl TaxID=8319 RepID=A0AAV7WAF7_PLEWA|nr:hypothetical protein NDU88_005217 [Pleurodeles waltl]